MFPEGVCVQRSPIPAAARAPFFRKLCKKVKTRKTEITAVAMNAIPIRDEHRQEVRRGQEVREGGKLHVNATILHFTSRDFYWDVVLTCGKRLGRDICGSNDICGVWDEDEMENQNYRHQMLKEQKVELGRFTLVLINWVVLQDNANNW